MRQVYRKLGAPQAAGKRSAELVMDDSSFGPLKGRSSDRRTVHRIDETLGVLDAKNASTLNLDFLRTSTLGLTAKKIGDRLTTTPVRRALNGAPNWNLANKMRLYLDNVTTFTQKKYHLVIQSNSRAFQSNIRQAWH